MCIHVCEHNGGAGGEILGEPQPPEEVKGKGQNVWRNSALNSVMTRLSLLWGRQLMGEHSGQSF